MPWGLVDIFNREGAFSLVLLRCVVGVSCVWGSLGVGLVGGESVCLYLSCSLPAPSGLIIDQLIKSLVQAKHNIKKFVEPMSNPCTSGSSYILAFCKDIRCIFYLVQPTKCVEAISSMQGVFKAALR